jgi:hypothetical protein
MLVAHLNVGGGIGDHWVPAKSVPATAQENSLDQQGIGTGTVKGTDSRTQAVQQSNRHG